MASFFLKSALLIGLACASPLTKRSFPNPEPCSGACSGDVHDPAVVYNPDSKTYYRFTTNDKINIATASSMNGPWTHQGSALPDGSSIDLPGNMDLWAPDVFNVDGTYYMYYAVSAIGSQNSDIGVATSTSMAVGTWTDHGSVGVPAGQNWNKIDPNLFQSDPTSPFLLSWGSFWENIFQIELANPPTSVASGAAVNHLEYNSTGSHYNEGSYQFQWNGQYYLFFSSGVCCNTPQQGLAAPGDEYKVLVCRSDSPTGGFVDQNGVDCLNDNGGTLVLGSHDDVYAPGGQGVFFDPNQNKVLMYYHYVNPSVSYDYDQFLFGYNVLDFSSGWPVVESS